MQLPSSAAVPSPTTELTADYHSGSPVHNNYLNYTNLHYLHFSPQLTRVGTLIVATTYLQLIQNRYMFRSFIVLHCSHQHCVQHVASDVEVVGYL